MQNKNIDEENCVHCPGGIGLEYPLFDDNLFWVVCDAHPLIEGHILIIPKEHISCMGNLSVSAFSRYKELYNQVKKIVSENYGSVAIFEHGITGQTVFHAHTHFFPFTGSTNSIISKTNALKKIDSLDQLEKEFKLRGKYLFFENANEMWFVDTSLGYPRFFRNIFAELLDVKDRADWKATRDNSKLMAEFKKDMAELSKKWKEFIKHN